MDREIPNLNSFSNIGTEGLIEGISFTDTAKRAYLGCYYLSTASVFWSWRNSQLPSTDLVFCRLSLGFQNHPELRYCKLMDSYGQSLVLHESSAEISSLIKLQRLSKRIAEAHSSEEPQGDPQMEALNSEVNIQMFQYELQEWRNSTPLLIRNLRTYLKFLRTLSFIYCSSSSMATSHRRHSFSCRALKSDSM